MLLVELFELFGTSGAEERIRRSTIEALLFTSLEQVSLSSNVSHITLSSITTNDYFSVGDLEPEVFGPHGSGSISRR